MSENSSKIERGGPRPKSQSRVSQVLQLKEEDIDFADIPDATDDSAWGPSSDAPWPPPHELAKPNKQLIHIRCDKDMLDWFKKLGRGYQTRMHAVLISYYKFYSVQRAAEKTSVKAVTPNQLPLSAREKAKG